MTDIAVSSRGLLAAFSAAGVLTWGDVHPAQQQPVHRPVGGQRPAGLDQGKPAE